MTKYTTPTHTHTQNAPHQHTLTHTQNTQLQHTHIGAHWRTHALSCAHARNTERNLQVSEVSEHSQTEILETKISGKTSDDVWCLIRFGHVFWPEPPKQTDWGSASKHRVHRLHTRLAADLLVLDYRAGHGARRFSALAPVRYWYFTSAYGRLQVPPRHEWTSGAHTCVCVVCSVCLLHVYGWGSVGSHHHICVWRKQGWRLRHTWILYTSSLYKDSHTHIPITRQKFNIHRCGDKGRLPSSHTCFNQLDLPEYTTEEQLRKNLLSAVREGFEGFGFS